MKPNNRYRLIQNTHGDPLLIVGSSNKVSQLDLNQMDLLVIKHLSQRRMDAIFSTSDSIQLGKQIDAINNEILYTYYPDEYPENESYEATQEAVK